MIGSSRWCMLRRRTVYVIVRLRVEEMDPWTQEVVDPRLRHHHDVSAVLGPTHAGF